MKKLKVLSVYFWNDLSSCANKIRISLELLMDNQNIESTYTNKKGELKPIMLHSRIKTFGQDNTDLAELLEAIKWIGNTGSHVGELSNEDILTAFEVLEYIINELYGNKKEEYKKWAKTINKNKGIKKKK